MHTTPCYSDKENTHLGYLNHCGLNKNKNMT